MKWQIFYADGTIHHSTWDSKSDVVAIVVFGRKFVTQTSSGPITERYRTLYFEDEDEAAKRNNKRYYFWMTPGGKIRSGYKKPRRGKIKIGTNPNRHEREHERGFEEVEKTRGT